MKNPQLTSSLINAFPLRPWPRMRSECLFVSLLFTTVPEIIVKINLATHKKIEGIHIGKEDKTFSSWRWHDLTDKKP